MLTLDDVEGYIEAVEVVPWPDEPSLLAVALHVLPAPTSGRRALRRHLFLVEDLTAQRLSRLLSEKTSHLDDT